ncbi:MAG: zinc ribbon domain-containing protein [Thermoleophilia bacterium]
MKYRKINFWLLVGAFLVSLSYNYSRPPSPSFGSFTVGSFTPFTQRYEGLISLIDFTFNFCVALFLLFTIKWLFFWMLRRLGTEGPIQEDDEFIFECDECGYEVNENDKLCPKCGANIEEIEEDF